MELEIDEIGPSLRYATAQVTRASSSGQGGQSGSRPAAQAPQEPWATAQPGAGGGQNAWGAPSTSYNDETPF